MIVFTVGCPTLSGGWVRDRPFTPHAPSVRISDASVGTFLPEWSPSLAVAAQSTLHIINDLLASRLVHSLRIVSLTADLKIPGGRSA
jgi:hypothetical protein